MDLRLDIIVFGATGFTGKYTLPHLYRLSQPENKNFKWGVAGRSEQKLKDVLNQMSGKISPAHLREVPIIIADARDEESIKQMTSRAKVLLNCCGPYDTLGEVVVKSCIASKTHYVDMSVEPHFVTRLLMKYHKEAEANGVYIANACGVDSVPSDLGILFLQKNFQGTLNSVELYLLGYDDRGSVRGAKGHFTTWESMVHSAKNHFKTNSFKRVLFPDLLPVMFPLPKRGIHKKGDAWAIPIPSANHDIVTRSQKYFYENLEKQPVCIESYLLRTTFVAVVFCLFLALIFFILAQFKFGRTLLLKYPEFFTYGYFSHTSPTEADLMHQHNSVTLYGSGWNEKIIGYNYKIPPNKRMVVCVKDTPHISPYDYTALFLVICTVTVLCQPEQLPTLGGVYTPAALFAKTSILEEMKKNGVSFEIISKEEE